jgi:RNA polymerase sigma-70 factor (ECF subfamily)
LERARARDQDAWRRLVDLYGPLVHHWCRIRLPSAQVEDVFQDVFQAVAAGLDRFRKRGRQDTFRGWLRVITENKINDHFRRYVGRPEAEGGTTANHRIQQVAEPPDEPESDSDQIAVSKLLHRALDAIRDQVDDRAWRAFWLTTVENQNATETALALGLTSNAVRKSKARILRRLREELGDLGDFEFK